MNFKANKIQKITENTFGEICTPIWSIPFHSC